MTTKEYLELDRKNPSIEYNPYKGWEEDLNKIKEFNKNLVEKYPWLILRNRWTDEVIEGYRYTELDSLPYGWRLAFGDQICEEIDQELRRFDYQDKYRIVQIKEKYGSLRWYDNGTPFKTSDKPFKEFTKKGFEVLERDWDSHKYCLRDLWSDHYINLFDENVDMTREEIDAYNKDAIHHYALYEITDTCKVPEIIDKYTELSIHTCINCGEPAKYMSKGWISPYCENCARSILKERGLDWEDAKNDNFVPIGETDEYGLS